MQVIHFLLLLFKGELRALLEVCTFSIVKIVKAFI